MPPKKAAAKAKSPPKKAVSKAKSPPKKAVAKSAGSSKKVTTSKDLRNVIPKVVPTDIVNLTKNYLYPEWREAAKYIYDNALDKIINPKLVDEEFFIENLTELLIKTYGKTFKDFMKKFGKTIKENGSDADVDIHANLFKLVTPPAEKNVWVETFWDTNISSELMDAVVNALALMSEREGYFKIGKKKPYNALSDYYVELMEENEK